MTKHAEYLKKPQNFLVHTSKYLARLPDFLQTVILADNFLDTLLSNPYRENTEGVLSAVAAAVAAEICSDLTRWGQRDGEKAAPHSGGT